jgi:lipopolysaccharide/colanic/teichoic acid biosynthesis glycosyltransferase
VWRKRLLKSIVLTDLTSNNIINFNPEFYLQRNMDLYKEKPVQRLLKRFIDITVSLAGIILLSPILGLLVLLIRFDSKGSAVFVQKRVGLHKKQFKMYKFRSMDTNAESKLEEIKSLNQTNPIMFKLYDDPRVTRIGKFLRKYSLDELPQLFNVLKGDMSLVGPRPPIPEELKKYQSWHYVKFLAVPGITGMWQVNGRALIKDFDKVINLDYDYIKNWNILLDIKILLKTIPVVFSGIGAG